MQRCLRSEELDRTRCLRPSCDRRQAATDQRHDNGDLQQADPDDTVRFIAVPTEMPADGASQETIAVQVNT